ncbi:MAG: tetratricopeptide repeat protein [bacterium]|nr:tetratricopeptide repeat protein [bacterium]
MRYIITLIVFIAVIFYTLHLIINTKAPLEFYDKYSHKNLIKPIFYVAYLKALFGNLDEAVTCYVRILNSGFTNLNMKEKTHYLIAKLYDENLDKENALKLYKEFLIKYPDSKLKGAVSKRIEIIEKSAW